MSWQPDPDPRQLTTCSSCERLSRRADGIPGKTGEVSAMLWTITIVLFILWVLGLVSSYTMGGWIHILLVLAVIVLIFNLLQGRRAL
jgi:hypothetical protein